jgi:hypothetical protein
MASKKCTKCGIEKELTLDNFYWQKTRNRWRPDCKLCIKQYEKDNSKHIKQYKKQYCQDHKEEIKQYQMQYRKENEVEIKQKQASYRQDNEEKIKQQKAEYYQENKEELKQQSAEHYHNNKEQIAMQKAEHYQENREELCAKQKKYRETNTEEIKKRDKERNSKPERKKSNNINAKKRRQNDPLFKFRSNISKSIYKILKSKCTSKNDTSVMDYLPYTIQDLLNHLEGLFEPWMTWENHGKYDPKTWDDNDSTTWTWQLDHITPHSDFYYTSMEDQSFKECWALDNLRPYSAKQNVLDGTTRIRHKKT